MEDNFRQQMQGPMHQHTSALAAKDANFDATQRAGGHLRAELRDAMHLGSRDAAAAKHNAEATAAVEQELSQARAHHHASMEGEARASRDAIAFGIRNAEAEAERRHGDALRAKDLEAHRHHEGVVNQLRSEFTTSVRDLLGPEPPCPQCPVKQVRICA